MHENPVTGSLPIAVDSLDRRLLLALVDNPTASFAELADGLGVSATTLSNRYRRLNRHGLIRITGRTAPGFGGGYVYLIRTAAQPDLIRQTAERLASYSNSRWVRISQDGSEAMCGLVTADPASDPILTSLRFSPHHRMIAVTELLHVWGGRTRPDSETVPETDSHSDGAGGEQQSADAHSSGAVRTADAVDDVLLAELAADGREPLSSVAARVGVSASTLSRRRQRLLDAGILYYEADVHPAALGGTGDAMMWMRVRPGQVRALGRTLHDDRRVRFAAASSGRYDIVIHVHVIDRPALVDFIDDVLGPWDVYEIETIPMGRVFKRNAV